MTLVSERLYWPPSPNWYRHLKYGVSHRSPLDVCGSSEWLLRPRPRASFSSVFTNHGFCLLGLGCGVWEILWTVINKRPTRPNPWVWVASPYLKINIVVIYDHLVCPVWKELYCIVGYVMKSFD